MSGFTDHFAPVATDYQRHRPSYPPALFTWLAQEAPHHDLTWDCACGTGQAAGALAGHFRRVLATDASEAQIRAAQEIPGVAFEVAPAESCPADDGSVALVTVAQALHWFNGQAFHRELGRVLSPGGLLAAWSYGRLETGTPALDALLHRFHDQSLAPWWPPERRHVINGYRDLTLPFEPLQTPDFAMQCHWNLPQLMGYLGTWSAVARCREATGQDPLQALAPALAAAWGDAATPRPVSWPLTLRVQRAPGEPTHA